MHNNAIQPDPFTSSYSLSHQVKTRERPWYLQKRDELRRFRWSLVPASVATFAGGMGGYVIDDPIADRWFR